MSFYISVFKALRQSCCSSVTNSATGIQPMVCTGSGARSNTACLHLVITDYEHIRDFLHLSFPDFKVQALVAQIYLDPNILGEKLCMNFARIGMLLVGDSDDLGLYWTSHVGKAPA